MNFKDLQKFIKIAKEEGATELKYESKDFKASVSFQTNSNIVSHAVHTDTVSKSGEASKVYAEAKNIHEVKSPFVGTFYTSPAPGKPNYIKVGDKVRPGKVLCILEAMKIMNEIEADVTGEVIEVCVENESLVEFGQPLFKIRT